MKNKKVHQAARLELIGQTDDGQNIPKEAVFRKIKSEFNAKEEWEIALRSACRCFHSTEGDKVLYGFIEDIKTDPDFEMKLYHKEQFSIIHKIDPKYRVLHVDATGKLVHIPKK